MAAGAKTEAPKAKGRGGKHDEPKESAVARKMETDALDSLDERDERVAKLQKNREPTGTDADKRADAMGLQGSEAIADPRESTGKVVPPRWSKSGEWESQE